MFRKLDQLEVHLREFIRINGLPFNTRINKLNIVEGSHNKELFNIESVLLEYEVIAERNGVSKTLV